MSAPYYQNEMQTLYNGDAREVLPELPGYSVDMVITSPPYYGLRKYKGEPAIWDNHSGCLHEWGDGEERLLNLQAGNPEFVRPWRESATATVSNGNFCLKCGAWKGQLGLEPTPELYIKHLCDIFDLTKRVLKKTGTLWVNIDDSYAGGGNNHGNGKALFDKQASNRGATGDCAPLNIKGIPSKSLIGIPERFVLEMLNRGWIRRNTIIWHKNNPMPESVKDRFTSDFEYLYMFSQAKEKSTDIRQWIEMPLKPEEASWLAAMVDAEGTIGVRHSQIHRPHNSLAAYITVNNINVDIINKCLALTGAGTKRKASAKVNFDVYVWEATHNKAVGVIGEIYPYLIAKREQAKVVIALQKLNINNGNQYQSGLREDDYKEKLRLWNLCKALNQHHIQNSGLPEPNLNRYSGCEDYYFEQQFEPNLTEFRPTRPETSHGKEPTPSGNSNNLTYNKMSLQGRNKRCVWTINTKPYKHAHFATFPPALVETPILAGCPLYICSKCGKPREKIYEHKNMVIERSNHAEESGIRIMSSGTMVAPCEDKFIGYSDCGCGEYTCNKCGTEMVFKHSEFIPGTVMDIFAGSGTTLQCALALGRKSIGIEQSEEYCKLATKRKMQVGF